MRIYQGPPGTGKTFNAKLDAARILDPSATEDNFQSKYEALYNQGRIVFVTFHANYAYEDFVEGYRPVLDAAGNMIYRVVEGPFRKLCTSLEGSPIPPVTSQGAIPPFSIGERIGDKGHYEVRDVNPAGVLLASKGNRKDAVTEEILHYVDFWMLKYLKERGVKPEDLSIPGKANEKKQSLSRKTGFPTTLWANSSHYRAVYQKLKDLDAGVLGSTPAVSAERTLKKALLGHAPPGLRKQATAGGPPAELAAHSTTEEQRFQLS